MASRVRGRRIRTVAPAWPDDPAVVEQARAHPEVFAKKRVGQATDHYLEAARALDCKPAVVGHSFRGLIAQKMAGEGVATVTVAIDPAPFRSVLPVPFSSLKSSSAVVGNPANPRRDTGNLALWVTDIAATLADAVHRIGPPDLVDDILNAVATCPTAGRASDGPHCTRRSGSQLAWSNARRGDSMISLGVEVMPDVLIRGLSTDAVERIDGEAAALGLSRNEYLRRKLETTVPASGAVRVSVADLRRAAEAASDLLDPEVMDSAWR